MKIQLAATLFAVLGSAMIVDHAEAQSTFLYLAHGAPGRGIASTTNPAFPVDFTVGGNCVATGLAFGDIRGPLTGPAGTYTVQFTVANSASPCTGAAVFTAVVNFAADTTYVGVLTLDSSNNPAGQIYTADLSPIQAGFGRIEVINTTQEPLDATLSGAGPYPLSPLSIQEFEPLPGLYNTTILDASNNLLVGPLSVEIAQRNSYLYVVAGWNSNQFVQLIGPVVISGVF